MHNVSSRSHNPCVRTQNKTYEDKIWRVSFLNSDSEFDVNHQKNLMLSQKSYENIVSKRSGALIFFWFCHNFSAFLTLTISNGSYIGIITLTLGSELGCSMKILFTEFYSNDHNQDISFQAWSSFPLARSIRTLPIYRLQNRGDFPPIEDQTEFREIITVSLLFQEVEATPPQ